MLERGHVYMHTDKRIHLRRSRSGNDTGCLQYSLIDVKKGAKTLALNRAWLRSKTWSNRNAHEVFQTMNSYKLPDTDFVVNELHTKYRT